MDKIGPSKDRSIGKERTKSASLVKCEKYICILTKLDKTYQDLHSAIQQIKENAIIDIKN